VKCFPCSYICLYTGIINQKNFPDTKPIACKINYMNTTTFKSHSLKSTEWPKKMYTLLQQFGGFDSVWMPMVATSNTYIELKIQGHLSYKFCLCINTIDTIIE